jgi:hypothetical protein
MVMSKKQKDAIEELSDKIASVAPKPKVKLSKPPQLHRKFFYPENFMPYGGVPLLDYQIKELVEETQSINSNEHIVFITSGNIIVVRLKAKNPEDDEVYICKILKFADAITLEARPLLKKEDIHEAMRKIIDP